MQLDHNFESGEKNKNKITKQRFSSYFFLPPPSTTITNK